MGTLNMGLYGTHLNIWSQNWLEQTVWILDKIMRVGFGCPRFGLISTAKSFHLGLYLDQKLTWQRHIKTKRQQLNLKVRQMSWLLG
jgi:hypothetical protein